MAQEKAESNKNSLSSNNLNEEVVARLPHNHGAQYNKYYAKKEGGKPSIYQEQYLNRFIERDVYALTQTFLSYAEALRRVSTEENPVLKIVDYGAGDGRYLSLVRRIADECFKKYGVKVELTVVDPAHVGLESIQEKLTGEGFRKTGGEGFKDIEQSKGGDRGYLAGVMESPDKNFTVRMVHNHVHDDLKHEARIIGKQHTGMCMFGVLSHIKPRKRRIETMKMLGEITSGDIIYTLPNRSRILQEQKKVFDYLREKGFKPYFEDLDPGDLYYTREDGKVVNFYHMYSRQELLEDMTLAGLKGTIEVQKIGHETTLTKSHFLSVADSWLSGMVPSSLQDFMAGYFLVKAHKDRGRFESPAGFRQKIEEERNAGPLRSKL